MKEEIDNGETMITGINIRIYRETYQVPKIKQLDLKILLFGSKMSEVHVSRIGRN